MAGQISPASPIVRLTGIFLVLTIIVSSSVLFAANYFEPQERPEEISAAASTKKAQPQNAFVDDLSKSPPPFLKSGPAEEPIAFGQVANPYNITARFVGALSEELDRANPNGPQLVDGARGLRLPNAERVVGAVVNSSAGKNIAIPDWEQLARNESVRILNDFSLQADDNYSRAFKKIMNRYFGTAELASLDLNNPASLARLGSLDLKLEDAIFAAKGTPAPEKLAGFHRSLIKLFVYENEALKIAREAVKDPFRASVIVEAQDANYAAAIRTFEEEFYNAVKTKKLSLESEPQTLIDGLLVWLGIKEAHAFLGIGDIQFDPAKIARKIWEYVQKIALNILKDQLIHRMVKQTIDWLQGGGKPQFITNWKGFLRQTADNVVGDILARTIPQVCESFGPLVKISLLPVEPSADVPVKCTLSQVIGNVKDFAQSFENGGWIAYGASLESSNNFYGVMIQVGEKVSQERAKEREAKKKEAQSGKGQLSSKTCIQWETVYEPLPDGQDGPPKPVKKCLDYSVTTPGSLLAGTISDAMGAPLHRIVNADDLVALINALINAGLTKLIELGKSGITKGLAGVQAPDGNPQASGCAALDVSFGSSTDTTSSSTASSTAACGVYGGNCGGNPSPRDPGTCDACWCGEQVDAIWAQRHLVRSFSCDSCWVSIGGKTPDEWRAWARGPVQDFIDTVNSMYDDAGSTTGCKQPKPNIDYALMYQKYQAALSVCAFSDNGTAAVCGGAAGGDGACSGPRPTGSDVSGATYGGP